MKNSSNEELLEEVARRLSLSERTIYEQQDMLRQLKELNNKLEQSEALKTHFISNIKNEINNPLASILALAQNLLRKEESLSAEMVKSIRLIYSEAHALDFQLDNIMTAAEIEAGGIVPQLVDANISQIVEQVIHSFRNAIVKKALSVEVNGDEQIHFVTDRHCFKIIVANLVSNAIKFSRERSKILINVIHGIDHITLSVKDAGQGIHQNDVLKIFDRFTQLDTGTVKKFQGHGVGLSVTKALTELLDGSVNVMANADGSTFHLYLPTKASDSGISTVMDSGTEILFDQAF